MLGEPDAVAHFGKFEEPPPARHALRRLHERHVPEVAVVVDERDAERGPLVRPHRPLRRDARGDADARAARRRLMDREAAGEAPRANRLRGVIERPGKRVVRPVRARTGKRRRRDGQPHNQTQSKEVSFHDALQYSRFRDHERWEWRRQRSPSPAERSASPSRCRRIDGGKRRRAGRRRPKRFETSRSESWRTAVGGARREGRACRVRSPP